jgi:hypothetical protein
MKYLCLGFLILDFLAFLALVGRDQVPISAPDQGSSPEATPESCGPEQARAEPVAAVRSSAGIQWFATWETGLREARRTGQPILLIAAAPHCGGVSGMW